MPKPQSAVPSLESLAVSEKERPGSHPGEGSSSQETVPPGVRRTFTAAEKLRLVKAASVALASGERGALAALLRKEGIYSSQLAKWQRQFGLDGEAGLALRRPGRKPRLDDQGRQLFDAKKAIDSLEKKLRIANALIGLQKKAQEVMALAQAEGES